VHHSAPRRSEAQPDNRHIWQHVTDAPDSQKNFLVVDQKTETSTIEGVFNSFTKQRKDIAIVLINQHVRAFHLNFIGSCEKRGGALGVSILMSASRSRRR